MITMIWLDSRPVIHVGGNSLYNTYYFKDLFLSQLKLRRHLSVIDKFNYMINNYN